ncbi:isocitrate/isopropylmalate family dehydrogenase, partial [Stieleria sp.]
MPGDGIGPEITQQAKRVLETIGEIFGHEFTFQSHLIGGIAIDETGD